MRSMTGYGRGDADHGGTKFRVELNSVNRKQSEITIGTILQAPGVMRSPEQSIDADKAWPAVERALTTALGELVKMREREGKHLAKDLIHRLKVLRQEIKGIRALYPDVVKKYRSALMERIQKAGLDLPVEDERLLKEVTIFADRSD